MNIINRLRKRLAIVSTMAFMAMVLGASAAFATVPAASSPVEDVQTEVTAFLTNDLPIIVAILVALFAAGLGVRAAWTAYANAKKGVSSVK